MLSPSICSFPAGKVTLYNAINAVKTTTSRAGVVSMGHQQATKRGSWPNRRKVAGQLRLTSSERRESLIVAYI